MMEDKIYFVELVKKENNVMEMLLCSFTSTGDKVKDDNGNIYHKINKTFKSIVSLEDDEKIYDLNFSSFSKLKTIEDYNSKIRIYYLDGNDDYALLVDMVETDKDPITKVRRLLKVPQSILDKYLEEE